MYYITYKKMNNILNKLDGQQYYKHIPYIIDHIDNISLFDMSAEIEEIIKRMFTEIQIPLKDASINVLGYDTFCLSYNFILYKFLELLKLDTFLICLFPLVELKFHKIIWKKYALL
jgi:hypothetical protein